MSVENDIKSLHKEIQKNIIVMLPKRYKKVCLYASVIDGNQVQNGEMFFYYFPSGILKKNQINVYQIPKIFDFEEEQYAKLEKDTVIIGVGTRIEIWDKEKRKSYNSDENISADEIAENMTMLGI